MRTEMTIQQLADFTGFERTHVGDMIRGKVKPRKEGRVLLFNAADALKVIEAMPHSGKHGNRAPGKQLELIHVEPDNKMLAATVIAETDIALSKVIRLTDVLKCLLNQTSIAVETLQTLRKTAENEMKKGSANE